MTEDEVVREVRAARDAFAASHGYDIQTMVAALRELGLASGREVVRLPPRAVSRPNPAPPQTGTACPLPEVQTSPSGPGC